MHVQLPQEKATVSLVHYILPSMSLKKKKEIIHSITSHNIHKPTTYTFKQTTVIGIRQTQTT